MTVYLLISYELLLFNVKLLKKGLIKQLLEVPESLWKIISTILRVNYVENVPVAGHSH
jgi:hypothetical protein